jgi:hypothetical protein
MKGDKFHFIQNTTVPTKPFAEGMNGDEDLGEDITMKGEHFHYNKKPVDQKLFATGMNGDEDLGEDITMKGDKFHFIQNQNLVALESSEKPKEKDEYTGVKDFPFPGPEQVLTLDPK